MFLGIDLGTSGLKCVLIDDEQQVVGSSKHALTVSRPQPLWSEQDPHEWWQAVKQAIDELSNHYPHQLSQLKAIGLSGQQHGVTLLDAQGQPLRPAMLWNDGRSMAQCDELLQRQPDATQITGNLLMPGFSAPKVLWVQQHEPEIFKQARKILLPKDYIRFCLSGDYATDMSDASGTSWLNVAERRWSKRMLAATDIDESYLPTLYEGSDITGYLKEDLRKRWNLSNPVAIVGGGGDNAASAISVNVIQSGSAFLSLGTSGVLFVSDAQYHANPKDAVHTMCHCLPNLWHEMNVHLSAASSLSWAAKLLGINSIDELAQLAAQHQPKATPLFLPYLSGERTPHNNPYARGLFFGADYDTGPAEFAQAVLEGVALSLADGQQGMQRARIDIEQCSVVGGGAKNLYWGQIIANCLNLPLIYHQRAEVGGAYGAARLAWLAQHGGDPSTAFHTPPVAHTLEPQHHLTEHYQQRLALFQKVYQANQDLFRYNLENTP